MNVADEIERIRKEIAERFAWIEFLEKNRAKLEPVPRVMFLSCGQVDFDNLSHSEVLHVVKAFGGKWKKEPSRVSDRVHYHTTLPDGRVLRCFQGQPPPSCKIIEVEEHVPEQIIPATVRKVKKLVCHPELPAVIATAAEKGASHGD